MSSLLRAKVVSAEKPTLEQIWTRQLACRLPFGKVLGHPGMALSTKTVEDVMVLIHVHGLAPLFFFSITTIHDVMLCSAVWLVTTGWTLTMDHPAWANCGSVCLPARGHESTVELVSRSGGELIASGFGGE